MNVQLNTANKSLSKLMVAITAVLVVIATGIRAQAATVAYDGSVLPESASPAWTPHVNPAASVSSDGDILTITTDDVSNPSAYYDAPVWSLSDPIAVEFRVRTVSISQDYVTGGGIGGPGNTFWNYALTLDKFWFLGASNDSYSIDTTVFHTYLMTVDSSNARLYIDGGTSPVLTTPGIAFSYNSFYFGDGGGIWGGTSQWDYVNFSLPEPASMSFIVLGAACLFNRRRKQA